MPFGKARSLFVRPIQSADLCFDSFGILAARNYQIAKLGSRIAATDLSALKATLNQSNAADGLLTYSADAIASALSGKWLFSLTNDLLASSLETSIAARQVAYLERFMHIKEITAAYRQAYPTAVNSGARLERLRVLQEQYEKQRIDLESAYKAENWASVIKETTTKTTHKGTTKTRTKLTPLAMRNTPYNINVTGTAPSNHAVAESKVMPQIFQAGSWQDLNAGSLGFDSQESQADNDLTFSAVSRGPDFRFPLMEARIMDSRAQIDLQAQVLEEKLEELRLSHVDTVLARSLDALDQSVRRLQLRYIDSFLIPPFSGVITAIYKDVGEAVQAGEPVMRLEDDSSVLLVGFVQSRLAISLGQKARIKTSNVFESADTATLLGRVVSVRGHDADDDEWDVIIECQNSNPPLPLNYHFDRDVTTIEFIP